MKSLQERIDECLEKHAFLEKSHITTSAKMIHIEVEGRDDYNACVRLHFNVGGTVTEVSYGTFSYPNMNVRAFEKYVAWATRLVNLVQTLEMEFVNKGPVVVTRRMFLEAVLDNYDEDCTARNAAFVAAKAYADEADHQEPAYWLNFATLKEAIDDFQLMEEEIA